MNSSNALQVTGDIFQRYDDVDGRVRPIRVSIDYAGRMPEGGIKPGENLYTITGSELRRRHEYTIKGLTQSFRMEHLQTHTEMRAELEAHRISEEVMRAIYQVVERGEYAPKFESVCDGQMLVIVEYDDLPKLPATSVSEPEQEIPVLSESGAWKIAG